MRISALKQCQIEQEPRKSLLRRTLQTFKFVKFPAEIRTDAEPDLSVRFCYGVSLRFQPKYDGNCRLVLLPHRNRHVTLRRCDHCSLRRGSDQTERSGERSFKHWNKRGQTRSHFVYSERITIDSGNRSLFQIIEADRQTLVTPSGFCNAQTKSDGSGIINQM